MKTLVGLAMNPRSGLTLGLVLALSGCAHTLTEKDKTEFETLARQQAFRAKKNLGPTKATRVPLQAGQWATVETEIKDDKGEIKSMQLATYKILGVSADAVTMEIETHSAGRPKPMTMAYVVSHFPSQSTQMGMSKADLDKYIDQLEFKRIITQSGNAKPTEIPTHIALMTKQYVKNLIVNGYRVGDIKNEPCATESLESSKCLAYDYQADLLGHTVKGHVDAHSAVPIVGFIRQDSGDATSRVIAFGLTGAQGKLVH